MILPDWFTPVLIGIDVLVVIYGLRVAVTEKKTYGWLLAFAFFLFGVKEVLPYNGVSLPPYPRWSCPSQASPLRSAPSTCW